MVVDENYDDNDWSTKLALFCSQALNLSESLLEAMNAVPVGNIRGAVSHHIKPHQ